MTEIFKEYGMYVGGNQVLIFPLGNDLVLHIHSPLLYDRVNLLYRNFDTCKWKIFFGEILEYRFDINKDSAVYTGGKMRYTSEKSARRDLYVLSVFNGAGGVLVGRYCR